MSSFKETENQKKKLFDDLHFLAKCRFVSRRQFIHTTRQFQDNFHFVMNKSKATKAKIHWTFPFFVVHCRVRRRSGWKVSFRFVSPLLIRNFFCFISANKQQVLSSFFACAIIVIVLVSFALVSQWNGKKRKVKRRARSFSFSFLRRHSRLTQQPLVHTFAGVIVDWTNENKIKIRKKKSETLADIGIDEQQWRRQRLIATTPTPTIVNFEFEKMFFKVKVSVIFIAAQKFILRIFGVRKTRKLSASENATEQSTTKFRKQNLIVTLCYFCRRIVLTGVFFCDETNDFFLSFSLFVSRLLVHSFRFRRSWRRRRRCHHEEMKISACMTLHGRPTFLTTAIIES